MQNYLQTFKNFIQPLGTDNVVIGGTLALKAHGLIMSREATDLDLIIFKPTDKQLEYIKLMSAFQKEFIDDEALKNPFSDYHRKSYKFKKNELIIDILLQDKFVPNDLLLFNFDGTYYKIQSVKNTIDAKRSYMFDNKYDSRTGNSSYIREKDVKDFNDLKNSNFNL